MSTDSQQQKQNKSMFILLSIISVLVISTLVVASVYFLKPAIEAPPHEPQTQSAIHAPIEKQANKPTKNPFTQNNSDSMQKQHMKSPAKVAATNTDPQTEKQSKRDGCDVRFYENQLLVKNAERNEQ